MVRQSKRNTRRSRTRRSRTRTRRSIKRGGAWYNGKSVEQETAEKQIEDSCKQQLAAVEKKYANGANGAAGFGSGMMSNNGSGFGSGMMSNNGSNNNNNQMGQQNSFGQQQRSMFGVGGRRRRSRKH
jgi:hypothetical protein